MKNVFKNRRRATVGTALGIALAIGGGLAVTSAGAQGGSDIGSARITPSSQSALPYAVLLGRSFVQYEWHEALGTPVPYLPGTRPNYSQINLQSTGPEILRTAGPMAIGQVGQLHADAVVMVKKDAGTGTAQVTCDLRVTARWPPTSTPRRFPRPVSRC